MPPLSFKIYFTSKFQDIKEIIYFSIDNLSEEKGQVFISNDLHEKHLNLLVAKKYIKDASLANTITLKDLKDDILKK